MPKPWVFSSSYWVFFLSAEFFGPWVFSKCRKKEAALGTGIIIFPHAFSPISCFVFFTFLQKIVRWAMRFSFFLLVSEIKYSNIVADFTHFAHIFRDFCSDVCWNLNRKVFVRTSTIWHLFLGYIFYLVSAQTVGTLSRDLEFQTKCLSPLLEYPFLSDSEWFTIL